MNQGSKNTSATHGVPSDLDFRDRLVVIEKGNVVESGTHEKLVNNSLIYSDLWKRQSGGFLAPEEYEKLHSNSINTL